LQSLFQEEEEEVAMCGFSEHVLTKHLSVMALKPMNEDKFIHALNVYI
jgi:hypothetical protein